MPDAPHDQLYLRQLLGGRDFARRSLFATQMENYVYLVGDRSAQKAVVIDCAYAPDEIANLAQQDGMELVGAVITHYHADHAGGHLAGEQISGIIDLLSLHDIPVHVQRDELSWLKEQTGIDESVVTSHLNGETLLVGDIPLTLIHTPGHTEGSQCILVDGHLFTGDTLFLDGCGRTDLPGGDPGELYETLTTRLHVVPDEVPIFPGHAYSRLPSASMGEVRRTNPVLFPLGREQWLARFS